MPTLVNSQPRFKRQLQKSSIQCINYTGHLHVYYSVVFRTQILTSHIFRPKTSVYSKKAAVNLVFISPLYRGSVSIVYRVFYITVSYVFTSFFHCCFHLRSAHFIISIVTFYLYQWPPILCYYNGTLLAWRWVFAWCASSPYISSSFSAAYRRRASQLV